MTPPKNSTPVHGDVEWEVLRKKSRLDSERHLREDWTPTVTHLQEDIDKGMGDINREVAKVLAGVAARIKTWSERSADVTRDIIAATNEDRARQMFPNIHILSEKELKATVLRSITLHLQNEDNTPTPGTIVDVSGGTRLSDNKRTSYTASDTNEDDVVVSPSCGRRKTTSREAEESNALATGTTGEKRTLSPELDAMPPRPKRARHSHPSTRSAYDIFDPDSEGDDSSDMRTILREDIEGTDFVFQLEQSNAFAVIRCDRGAQKSHIIHRFTADPFWRDQAAKHFATKYPRTKCHDKDTAKTSYPGKKDMIKEFGYRVIDSEGNNVSREWVEASNERLAAEQGKGKEKDKTTKPKTNPNTKPKTNSNTTPKGKDKANLRLRPVEYGDAQRPPYTTSATSASAASKPTTAAPETGAPVTSTSSTTATMPEPDMRVVEPDNSRGQPEDDVDALFDPIISDIVS